MSLNPFPKGFYWKLLRKLLDFPSKFWNALVQVLYFHTFQIVNLIPNLLSTPLLIFPLLEVFYFQIVNLIPNFLLSTPLVACKDFTNLKWVLFLRFVHNFRIPYEHHLWAAWQFQDKHLVFILWFLFSRSLFICLPFFFFISLTRQRFILQHYYISF